MASSAHRVVIIGGGFGGLAAARALRDAPVEVTVVDRANHHLFQPLLYQVATGLLTEGEIAPPLRGILRDQRNARVLLADVTGIDLAARSVATMACDGEHVTLGYDSLVVAAGARHAYFGHDEWERFAPGLKTLEDARRVRTRILGAFERAAAATEPAQQAAWLTFVVVGAGPTGVEVTGQISELAREALRRDYTSIDTASARIVLIDAGESVLGSFPDRLRRRAARDLGAMPVDVRLRTRATSIDDVGVEVTRPDGGTDRIRAHTVIWAAGVHASPLARLLGEASGAEVDGAGRVAVRSDCTLPGHPEVFAIGDMVSLHDLPGVAQPALQEGRHAARVIEARLRGEPSPPPFRYHDKGTMAALGSRSAVADAYGVKLGGVPALVVWAVVHIAFLVGWANRVVTLMRWGWTLATRKRGERVITVQTAERIRG